MNREKTEKVRSLLHFVYADGTPAADQSVKLDQVARAMPGKEETHELFATDGKGNVLFAGVPGRYAARIGDTVWHFTLEDAETQNGKPDT